MKRSLLRSIVLVEVLTIAAALRLPAQDWGSPGDAPPRWRLAANPCTGHYGSSPFDPPPCDDCTFVVDQAPGGLDTGCTYRSGGPLTFSIDIPRVVTTASIQSAIANGIVGPYATLRLPAYDVDFNGGSGTYAPERDRVRFNGHVVPGEFLTGDNGIWKLNAFQIPIEWVNFPPDPGSGGTSQPAQNQIQIEIDTLNAPDEVWCTAIDWAALEIQAVRPVLMVHGILSDGTTWNNNSGAPAGFSWVNTLTALGLPNSNDLNMGALGSIHGNAVQIASKVAELRQRFGVQKVNLVCHSKGGLDAREFAESSDSIERVIQLGTPNAGSPLADEIQSGLVRLAIRFGPLGAIAWAVSGLAAPAGIQLTTLFMATYNSFHGYNPRVSYLAAAGNYDPACPALQVTCRPLDRLLLSITGPGDTIVPVDSVHALGYMEHRTLSSAGAFTDAKHNTLPPLGTTIAMTNSGAFYQLVRDAVMSFAVCDQTQMNVPLALAATAPVAAAHPRTGVEVGRVAAGHVDHQMLAIDDPSDVVVSLVYPSGELDLALISPSGQRFDATTIPQLSNAGYERGEVLGGKAVAIQLASPQQGLWQAEVHGLSVVDPSGATSYALTGWLSSPAVTFQADLVETHVAAGMPLTIRGTLQNSGAAVAGATVTAEIQRPDDATSTVTLVDNGMAPDLVALDGVYTGSFAATSLVGTYRIAIRAEIGTGPLAPSSRDAFALATVSSGAATAMIVSEQGTDTNQNQLFDYLDVRADLTLATGGDYRVTARLEDTAGHVHQAAVLLSGVTSGLQQVTLRFDGGAIFRNHINGPYTLTALRIAEVTGGSLLPVLDLAPGFATAAYLHTLFEHPPVYLTGAGNAVGVDTNSNTLFDQLQVSIDVAIENPGSYDWTARLADSSGVEIDFFSGSANFTAGTNTMSFVFDGQKIGAHGIAGPYYVRDLLLFSGSNSLVQTSAFTTQSFTANEFEGFTGMPPAFAVGGPCGTTIPAQVGSEVAVTIQAADPDGGDLVVLDLVDAPSGATVDGGRPVTGNPAVLTLRWTPDTTAVGQHLIHFTARDRAGLQISCAATIDVAAAPASGGKGGGRGCGSCSVGGEGTLGPWSLIILLGALLILSLRARKLGQARLGG